MDRDNWPEEDKLKHALRAWRDGVYKSLKKAANAFDVSYEKLLNRRDSVGSNHTRGGQNKLLSEAQEEVVCFWINRMLKHGFPPRYDLIAQAANKVLMLHHDDPSKAPPTVGQNWASRFVRRKS